MAAQPQSYGSIREFLDNLPNQPCIWQPENANICVTCLRINEPVARVCSVWAQALEEAPLEEIDFEEEVKSLPSVVEIEDDFEMVEAAIPVASPVAEVDIVEASSDWDMVIDDSAVSSGEEVAETVIEAATDAFGDIVENEIVEPESIDTNEDVAGAVIEAATDATEEVVESAIEPEAVEAETVPIELEAEPVAVEPEAVEAKPVPIEPEATEEIALDTIQDAVEAENIAKENVENASETEVQTAETVIEALDTETEAVEAYAEAVKEEIQAAEAVVEAVEAKNIATEAVIESAEQVNELVENKAEEDKIKEVVTELKENIEKQEETEEILVEALTNEDKAAEDVGSTSTEEEKASKDLEKAIEADEKASEDLEEAVTKEEKAEEEVQEAVESSKSIRTLEDSNSNENEPFIEGDLVTHGVYGEGTVLQLNKAGKHWSIEVNFKEGKRRILGTFLTLNETLPEIQEPVEQSFKRPEDFITTEAKQIEDKEKNKEVAEVVADVVEVDHGDYLPGAKVLHDIFGTGKIKNSEPKGEAYRLNLEFEDGTERTLLSTFVKLMNDESSETKAVEAEPVPIEPETVLDTDIIYQRPKDKEAILDLSKPEVQDAEMIDDED